MENLKRKIKVLGTELLVDIKKKVKDLQVQEEHREKVLDKKWQEKTENKLSCLQRSYDIEIEHLEKKNEADSQLKEQLALLEVKNHFFSEVKNEVLNRIKSQLEQNYSSYIDFIQKEIQVYLDKVRQDSTITFNDRDKKYFTTKDFPKSRYKLTFDDKTLDINGGFELETKDGNIKINSTLESLFAKQELIILTEFNNLIRSDLV